MKITWYYRNFIVNTVISTTAIKLFSKVLMIDEPNIASYQLPVFLTNEQSSKNTIIIYELQFTNSHEQSNNSVKAKLLRLILPFNNF